MNTVEAERLVQEVRDSAVHCAERALSKLRSGLGTTGLGTTGLGTTGKIVSIAGTEKDLWSANGCVISNAEIVQNIRHVARLKAAGQADSSNRNPSIRRAA